MMEHNKEKWGNSAVYCTVFTARRCVSAELVFVGCCPSVRPSVTGVFYQTAKDIVECFSHPDIHIIVVSRGHLVLPNSKGNAIYGALNRGGWENTVFGQYLKTYLYGYCGTSIGSHRCPVSSMTLSDLERRDTRGSVYPYARIVWPTAVKFSMVTCEGACL